MRSGFACGIGILLSIAPAWADLASGPGKLRIYQAKEFVTLDWTKSTHAVNFPLIANLHEGLVRLAGNQRLAPALADRWTASPDHKTFKIHLKRGVKWSDGTPFTAQQVSDGWRRALSPTTAAPNAYLLFDIEGAEAYNSGKSTDFSRVGVKVVSETEVDVALRAPNPSWLYVLTSPMTFPVREDLIRKLGNVWTKPGNLVGLGPFVLASHEFNQRIVLKPNPYYFDAGRGNVRELEFVICSPEQARDQFKGGSLDLVLKAPPLLRAAFMGRPELKWAKPVRTKRISFNLKQFPVSTPLVRRAIAQALDRAELARRLGKGYVAGASFAPPGVEGHAPGNGVKLDLGAAKRTVRRIFGFGSSVSVSLVVPTFDENKEENIQTASYIRDTLLKQLGLAVEITEVAEYAQWSILAKSGQFAMTLHDWESDYPAAYNFYAAYSLHSKHLNSRWDDPKFTELIDQARVTASEKARLALYRKADKLLVEENVVMIPLYYSSESALVGPRVKAYEPGSYPQSYSVARARVP